MQLLLSAYALEVSQKILKGKMYAAMEYDAYNDDLLVVHLFFSL